MIRPAIFAMFLLAAPAIVAADELRDFCANRPGKGSPPCILDQGYWQLEGDVFDRATGHGDTTLSLADMQMRYGLTYRSEIDISFAPFLDEDADGSKTHGYSDLTLSLRWALTDPDGKGLAVSLQPFVTAPTGSHDFSADAWEGGLTLPIAVPLSDVVSLSLAPTVASARNASGNGDHVTGSGAVGVAETIGSITLDEELWGAIDDDPAGRTRPASLDLAIAWLPAALKDTQIDGGVNFGLNNATSSKEVYMGLAHRF